MSKRSRRPTRSGTTPTAPTDASRSGASREPASVDVLGSASGGRAAAASIGTGAVADRVERGNRGPSGAERAGRRDRPARARVDRRSFAERHRGAIVGLGMIVIVVGVAGFVLFQSTQKLYACSSLFQPAATAAPGPSASPEPGYPQPDMGNQHIAVGTSQTYTLCPPASGRHYNAPGVSGPIPARYYGPNDSTVPQNWVHNLEHGALVVLYSCNLGGCDDADQQKLQALVTSFPSTPICHIAPGGNLTPVVTRFEDMPHRFAALVWGRVFYEDTLDTAAMLDFYAAEGERGNPEQQCAAPSPSASPGASGSPGDSGSPAASPGASGSTAPSTSPVVSASPS